MKANHNCLDGISDFGKATGLPILKDYTICALRKWLYDDSVTSTETGSIVSKSRGAFILEQTLGLNSVRCGTWNFGTFNALEGCDKLIEESYNLLGLKTYFTCGPKEVKAWTYKDGMNAKECAGIIHSDFEKGFIKAEVISYNDLIEAGSELKVKENGKFRIEGKEYLMQDGDICHFRFNL